MFCHRLWFYKVRDRSNHSRARPELRRRPCRHFSGLPRFSQSARIFPNLNASMFRHRRLICRCRHRWKRCSASTIPRSQPTHFWNSLDRGRLRQSTGRVVRRTPAGIVSHSPVPTHTFLEFFGSRAIAPIDCTDCSSNTGRYRVPLSSDFQTPPLAAPTKSVIFPDGSRFPAMAETRPLIVAEPMLRAPRPEMVAELNGASSARQNTALRKSNRSNMAAPVCLRATPHRRWSFNVLIF